VPKNPVCRKTLWFGGLKSPPHKYIKLQSVYYCSLAISLQVLDLQLEKILQFGYAVDRPVESVKSCCRYYPLLYHDYRSVSEFRGHGTKVLSRKNLTPSFEHLEHKETCVPSLSGQRGRHKTPSDLPRLYNVVLTGTLAVLYYALYRIHIKCGVLLEFSISSHQLAASCPDHRIRQLWSSNCEMRPQ
jgi:hypothetical protein